MRCSLKSGWGSRGILLKKLLFSLCVSHYISTQIFLHAIACGQHVRLHQKQIAWPLWLSGCSSTSIHLGKICQVFPTSNIVKLSNLLAPNSSLLVYPLLHVYHFSCCHLLAIYHIIQILLKYARIIYLKDKLMATRRYPMW